MHAPAYMIRPQNYRWKNELCDVSNYTTVAFQYTHTHTQWVKLMNTRDYLVKHILLLLCVPFFVVVCSWPQCVAGERERNRRICHDLWCICGGCCLPLFLYTWFFQITWIFDFSFSFCRTSGLVFTSVQWNFIGFTWIKTENFGSFRRAQKLWFIGSNVEINFRNLLDCEICLRKHNLIFKTKKITNKLKTSVAEHEH